MRSLVELPMTDSQSGRFFLMLTGFAFFVLVHFIASLTVVLSTWGIRSIEKSHFLAGFKSRYREIALNFLHMQKVRAAPSALRCPSR